MHFLAWEDYCNFYLAFWGVDFHKIWGRESLSRSHSGLHRTEDNLGCELLQQLSCGAHAPGT
jgi:hypothetical protein